MSHCSTRKWAAAHNKQQQLDLARAVDFRKLFGHAFADGATLDSLTVLHHNEDCCRDIKYVRLFATLYDRIKASNGKIRSRGTPVFFCVAGGEPTASMKARLRYNAELFCKDTKVDARTRLGVAQHAGLESTAMIAGEVALAQVSEIPDNVGERQLHAARYNLGLDRLDAAARCLVRHFRFYGEWGRAAGVVAWYGKKFVTAGVEDWMSEVVRDNATIHAKPVVVFETDQHVVDAIDTEKLEVPFVEVEDLAHDPIMNSGILVCNSVLV